MGQYITLRRVLLVLVLVGVTVYLIIEYNAAATTFRVVWRWLVQFSRVAWGFIRQLVVQTGRMLLERKLWAPIWKLSGLEWATGRIYVLIVPLLGYKVFSSEWWKAHWEEMNPVLRVIVAIPAVALVIAVIVGVFWLSGFILAPILGIARGSIRFVTYMLAWIQSALADSWLMRKTRPYLERFRSWRRRPENKHWGPVRFLRLTMYYYLRIERSINRNLNKGWTWLESRWRRLNQRAQGPRGGPSEGASSPDEAV